MQESFLPSFEQLDPEARAALGTEIKRLAASCRARDYNEEGIPMYLVLEDVADPSRSPQTGTVFHNTLLASAAALVLEALEFDEVGPKEIATVFEVLASQLFTLNASATLAPAGEGQ